MQYSSELDFAQRVLLHYRLKFHIVTEENQDISYIDLGLRKLLGLEEKHWLSEFFFKEDIKPNTIYKMTDIFYCNYFILLLPETTTNTYLIIGPYTLREFNKSEIMEFTEEYSLPPQFFNTLEQYFNNLPYLENETTALVVLNALGESL